MRAPPPRSATLSAISAVARTLRNCRWAAASGPFAGAPLLSRRMRALQLMPADLALDPSQQFSDLQRRCARCDSKGRCEAGLANEFTDPGWDAWRNYCPNATILAVSSALRACRAGAARLDKTTA